MLSCRICNCTCDPGDLRDGVCDECRHEQHRKQMINTELQKLAIDEFNQIRLEDILNENSN